jgi:ribonuclease Z
LLKGPVADATAAVTKRPVAEDGVVEPGPPLRIVGRALDHRTATVGWRLEEPDTIAFDTAKLAALGIEGPAVGELRREGSMLSGGRRVTVEDVSYVRAGSKVAFIMDTRICDAARELADDVDLLVCESTYLESEAELADNYAHMTAAQAAALARDAGARKLVLTHYSSRYKDPAVFAAEAAPIFAEVVAVNDLDVIAVPRRR